MFKNLRKNKLVLTSVILLAVSLVSIIIAFAVGGALLSDTVLFVFVSIGGIGLVVSIILMLINEKRRPKVIA